MENTSSAVRTFTNSQFGSIRTMEREDTVWFVGKDIAVILGYTNPTKAMREKVDDEDKLMSKMDTSFGIKDTYFINESGLYSLILSSKLPKAKEFKHWVTSEVLPSIRKHGVYMTPQTLTEMVCQTARYIRIDVAFQD